MFVMKCVVGRREGKEEQADTLQVQTLNYNIFKQNILQQYIEIYSNNIVRRRYLGLSLCHSQTQWPVSLLKNTCKQCCNLFKFFKKAKCNAYKVLDRYSPDEFRFSLPLGPLHKIHQNPASDASPTGQNHSRQRLWLCCHQIHFEKSDRPPLPIEPGRQIWVSWRNMFK